MKKILTFVGGAAAGAYMMYNHLFKKTVRDAIKRSEKNEKENENKET